MLAYISSSGSGDDESVALYSCIRCGTTISDASALLLFHGRNLHTFTNPSGVVCTFLTFGRCGNAISHPDLFVEYSWFPGYGWKFLSCKVCGLHLGWEYDAVRKKLAPDRFFGILVDALELQPREPTAHRDL